MSVQNTVAKLQGLHRTINGIQSAPDKYPGSINTADLPMMLTFPAEAVTNRVTARPGALTQSNRAFITRLYIEAVGQNNYDVPVQDGMELLQRVLDRYEEKRKVEGTNQLVIIGAINDTGIITGGEAMSYSGNEYIGVEFRLTITELTCTP